MVLLGTQNLRHYSMEGRRNIFTDGICIVGENPSVVCLKECFPAPDGMQDLLAIYINLWILSY